MAEDETAAEEAPKKRSKKPLVFGLIAALLFGGGGFYAAYSGLLPVGGHEKVAEEDVMPLPDVAFVPIEPMTISLGLESRSRHLRFTGQLEVPINFEADVTKMLPRVVDVLNSYLRAVETRQFDEPSALIRLRAQMLRRVQIVVGEGRVRDLLVTEFVLN